MADRLNPAENPEDLPKALSQACEMGQRFFKKHPTSEWRLADFTKKITGSKIANELCEQWLHDHEDALKAAFRAGWKDARLRYQYS